MDFIKMHGTRNSYLFFEGDIEDPSGVSRRLSREYGSDGIILILPSDICDYRMRIFNADGSEARMCGNGSRCVAKYVVEKCGCDKSCITLETLSGVKRLYPHSEGGTVKTVTVDMGIADICGDMVLSVDGIRWNAVSVSMGNPHCVVWHPDPYSLELERIGPMFENSAAFPDRVNTEFGKVLSRKRLMMRVWERGSGETMACGTGACALAAAAVYGGYCDPDTDITVSLRGGDLSVRVNGDYRVFMTGPAEYC